MSAIHRFYKALPIGEEHAIGNSASVPDVDWREDGPLQAMTLTNSPTIGFDSDPPGPCFLQLKLTQGGAGTFTATWPVSVDWGDAGAPALGGATGDVSLVGFFYDGSAYFGSWAEYPA